MKRKTAIITTSDADGLRLFLDAHGVVIDLNTFDAEIYYNENTKTDDEIVEKITLFREQYVKTDSVDDK